MRIIIVIKNNDRQIIGNPNPRYTGGLNQQFSYKNWDLSLFLNFSVGNDIYNANTIPSYAFSTDIYGFNLYSQIK